MQRHTRSPTTELIGNDGNSDCTSSVDEEEPSSFFSSKPPSPFPPPMLPTTTSTDTGILVIRQQQQYSINTIRRRFRVWCGPRLQRGPKTTISTSSNRGSKTHTIRTSTNRNLFLVLSLLLNVVMLILLLLLLLLYFGGGRIAAPSSSTTSISPSKQQQQQQHDVVVWHGGHPLEEHKGSCYCGEADGYCMCTPNLAIDLIITSIIPATAAAASSPHRHQQQDDVDNGNTGGEQHQPPPQQQEERYVWLIRRNDTQQFATMGGFVNVNETVEQAIHRELHEEMGIELEFVVDEEASPYATSSPFQLWGVYSDPRRDARRRTVSVVYVVQVDDDALQHNPQLHAGDDAIEIVRIPIHAIEHYTYFADHRTILLDYRQSLQQHPPQQQYATKPATKSQDYGDFATDIQRSICHY